MGHLLIGNPPETIRIEDRTLAHLKVVILNKFRRREGIAFSYEYADGGSGRRTVWMSPDTLLRFEFDGSRQATLNKSWLQALMATANDAEGLRIVAEPDPADTPSPPTTIPLRR